MSHRGVTIMVVDLHFPRFFGTTIQCEIARRFSEKRSESRSQRSMQKYQYFEWGSTLNLDGFKIIIYQYIICSRSDLEKRDWQTSM